MTDLDANLARRLIGEDSTGEDLVNEYAVENGLALPVNLEAVDLADVAKKKPLAVVLSSVLRRRLATLIAESLDIDFGVSGIEYVPGEYDAKGEGRRIGRGRSSFACR